MKAERTNANKVRITKAFVDRWSARYDEDYLHSEYHPVEQSLKTWLAEQRGQKFLDKGRFLKLAAWKSPRAKRHHERNDSDFVREVTELAFQQDDERLSLHILMALDGVGMPVASALLHFAFPDRYPILDFHVVQALTEVGLWQRAKAPDFTLAEWLKFTQLMRERAGRLGVPMRDLDKALWAFDKFGPKPEGG